MEREEGLPAAEMVERLLRRELVFAAAVPPGREVAPVFPALAVLLVGQQELPVPVGQVPARAVAVFLLEVPPVAVRIVAAAVVPVFGLGEARGFLVTEIFPERVRLGGGIVLFASAGLVAVVRGA